MQDFSAVVLFELCKEIGRIVTLNERFDPAVELANDVRAGSAKVMDSHAGTFERLALPICAAHCRRMIDELSRPLTAAKWTSLLNELYNRMNDECGLIGVLALTHNETQLFYPSSPLFGADFANHFPVEGVFELDRAGSGNLDSEISGFSA
jgi:hypothetical protein